MAEPGTAAVTRLTPERCASRMSERCPTCDRPLVYERSHIGGVTERFSEQWDYYTCTGCGPFQYRQRTRALRSVE